MQMNFFYVIGALALLVIIWLLNFYINSAANRETDRLKKLDAAIRGNLHKKGALLLHKKKEKKPKTAFHGKVSDKLAHAVEQNE